MSNQPQRRSLTDDLSRTLQPAARPVARSHQPRRRCLGLLLGLLLANGCLFAGAAAPPALDSPAIDSPALDSPANDSPVKELAATELPATGLDTSAQPPVAPTLFRAVYKADYRGLPIRATGVRELQQVGDNQYRLSSSATSFLASISEHSVFSMTPEARILPEEYQYHRKGIGKNRDAILSFDWTNNKVLNDVQQQPWKMDIPVGALDKLSYQLQMRLDLVRAHQQNLPWPPLVYQVADGGRMKTYTFDVVGEESVATPVGDFKALKISRVREDSDRLTTFWLAPEYEFLLVRFLQQENKGGFELVLKEAVYQGEPVNPAAAGGD